MADRRIFISYVREDAMAVDALASALSTSGFDAWMDRTHLKAGMRWQPEIQTAISNGDYFLACFSEAYNNRQQSYMNEELIIAVKRLRQMPRNRRWFIPVRLEPCAIPDHEIGPGETLNQLHYVDLFPDWDNAVGRLISDLRERAVQEEGTNPKSKAMEIAAAVEQERLEWDKDPSFNYFGEPQFTELRRAIDRYKVRPLLSPQSYEWVLLGALYDGNIPTSLLPALDDPAILEATRYWLRRRGPRGPRYRSAALLERCTVPGRDEVVERALAESGFQTADQLADAIRRGTVVSFIDDPTMSYDLNPAVDWDRRQRGHMIEFWERMRDYYGR